MSIKNMDPLNFEAIVKWNDEIAYAASYNYNALFKVFLSNGDAEYLQMFPDEKPNGKRLFTVAVRYDEKIYFVPAAAEHIAVYEPDKNNLYNLPIEAVDQDKNLHYKRGAKFNGGMVVGKYVYMMPCTYPGFIRIDPENDTVEYYDDWVGDGDYLFRKAPLIDENIIYLPSTMNNKILKIDTNTCSGQLLHIDTKQGGWWSMCKRYGDYWLSPQMPGPIIRWNTKTNAITEFGNYPTAFDGRNFYFTRVFQYDDKIVLISARANMSIILDTVTGDMIPLILTKNNKDIKTTTYYFEMDGYIYLGLSEESKVQYIKLNIENLSTESFKFRCSKNVDRLNYDMQCNLMKSNASIKENRYFELADFLMRL